MCYAFPEMIYIYFNIFLAQLSIERKRWLDSPVSTKIFLFPIMKYY